MAKLVNGRHLKALLKKNWIVWRRTPIVSALEIVFPILFMSIIIIARSLITSEVSPAQNYLSPQLYQGVKISPITFHYPFYAAANITKGILYERANYSFLNQTASAFETFYPQPCLSSKNKRRIIGIFPKDNITQIFGEQLTLWSAQQRVTYGYFQGLSVMYFNTEQQLLDYVGDPQYEIDPKKPGLCMAVSHYATGDNHAFKFHFDDQNDENQNMPNQKNPVADVFSPSTYLQDYFYYSANGYSIMQSWVANALLRSYTKNPDATIVHMSVPMQSAPQTNDDFSMILQQLLPLCLVLMYILPINRTIGRIVADKENRNRESMRMMGMSDTAYWLSWFIYYISISTTIALMTTIILATKALPYSNWGLLFFTFWLFGLSLFGYVIFVQAFFTKPRTASIIGTLIYFFTAFLDYAVQNNYMQEKYKTLAAFLPTIAMKRACANIAVLEQAQIGLQSDNIASVIFNYKVSTTFYMLTIFFVCGVLIGFYLTNVLPSAEGLRMPWYYPVTRYYWCGHKPNNKPKTPIVDDQNMDMTPKARAINANFMSVNESINLGVVKHPALKMQNQQFQSQSGKKENVSGDDIESQDRLQPYTPITMKNHNYDQQLPTFGTASAKGLKEPGSLEVLMEKSQKAQAIQNLQNNGNFEIVVSSDLQKQELDKKILSIHDLKKTFSNGYQAVSGLNVKMYNGQIFALLGHNGAGKTTTISMLTGLLSSSSGSAEVFGHDLFNEMESVRSFLGVCPQHDILFGLLSPLEHLEIFCEFKGVNPKQAKDDIHKMLKDIDLWHYKDTMAQNLSGGNRRKLSVAIALIGNSKLVLLDEPTAGMDLSARRKLWNMLKNYKNNRIIILTTHYMDEADILGDRIGIMTGGKLICLGSSLFLKNRFGVGYNLTMVKKNKEPNTLVGDYFQKNLGMGVKMLHEVSSEITYQIPTQLSYMFKDFFNNFDKDLDSLNIRSYGISVTTLEEVFLKVGSQGADISNDSPIKTQEIDTKNNAKGSHASGNKFIDTQQNFDSTNVNSNNMMNNNIVAKFNKVQNSHSKKNEDEFDHEEQNDPMTKELEDFCIANQVQDNIFKVFILHVLALFMKRLYIYRRNLKGLIIEVFIPVLLVLIGFAFSKVQFYYSSPERVLTPSLFPLKQRILVNSDLVAKSPYDISPQQLISNLPSFGSAFQATYKNYSYINPSTGPGQKQLLQAFDQDVYNQREEGDSLPYRYGSYFVYEANNQTKMFKVSTFVNSSSQDSTALFPLFMYESILKQATGVPNLKFTMINSPFPVSQKLRNQAANINSVFIVFVLAIGFALIPASIISFILHEREQNLKHMQLISGMNLTAYWVSNYIFDTFKAMVPVCIVIGLMYAFDLNYPEVWRVFLMFPVGVVPFTYATSFLFQNENVAQSVTIFTHFVLGGIGAIVVFLLRVIDSTYVIGDNLMWVFKVVPTFCLTNSVMFSSGRNQLANLRPKIDVKIMSTQNLAGDIIVLAIHFIVWTLLLILVETGIFQKIWNRMPFNRRLLKARDDLVLDDDVIEEEERVESIDKSKMCVRVNRFRKVYQQICRKPHCAVERTSFGLDYGECFALLGVNGAGKTTTFKSLTNDTQATSGEITINGMDVQKQFSLVRKQIGYCPQHNAIFDLMTVEEHLQYYARIKGIPSSIRRQMIEKEIKEMNLSEHRKKPAGTLSGGNKRKLSVAMAVLGNPPIILLDEPSAGMDPEARRFMWKVVAKISQQRKQSAVILTTHSMEEAEALSTKMGIMVKGGVFRCFGSSQHIKSKFGTGYEIEVKVRKMSQEELQKMTLEYQIDPEQEHLTLEKCKEIMRMRGINEFLVEEIKLDGLGSDLYKEAEEYQGNVYTKNFLTWLNTELFGQVIIHNLVQSFNQVELLEHYSDYYKLRVPRQDKSIGYVFGMIEDKKNFYGISEYSVSQTTLEQIFQTFAQMEVDATKGIVFEIQPNGSLGVRTGTAIISQASLIRKPTTETHNVQEQAANTNTNQNEEISQQQQQEQ